MFGFLFGNNSEPDLTKSMGDDWKKELDCLYYNLSRPFDASLYQHLHGEGYSLLRQARKKLGSRHPDCALALIFMGETKLKLRASPFRAAENIREAIGIIEDAGGGSSGLMADALSVLAQANLKIEAEGVSKPETEGMMRSCVEIYAKMGVSHELKYMQAKRNLVDYIRRHKIVDSYDEAEKLMRQNVQTIILMQEEMFRDDDLIDNERYRYLAKTTRENLADFSKLAAALDALDQKEASFEAHIQGIRFVRNMFTDDFLFTEGFGYLSLLYSPAILFCDENGMTERKAILEDEFFEAKETHLAWAYDET